MLQQGLDETQIRPAFQEVGREGMAQAVDASEFSEPGFFTGILEYHLKSAPIQCGTGLLGFKDKELGSVAGEVFLDGFFQGFRQHDNPILSAFAIPDPDDLTGEIDILNLQRRDLANA